MSKVWSCNEWDPLEEVIVGNPLNARFPTADLSTRLAEFPDRSLADIPQGAFPQQIIEETEEDLNAFVEVLQGQGVTVRRPDTWPHEETFSTINWESEGYYNYCPRDVMMVIGDTIIETPNVIRSRYQETFSYLLNELTAELESPDYDEFCEEEFNAEAELSETAKEANARALAQEFRAERRQFC